MAEVKFDELDRDRVIDAVEKHYGVQLDKVSPFRKWLRDASGGNWWVLGGVGDWHGIPKEMMADEAKRNEQIDGKLIIAVRKRTSIEVFVGTAGQLVRSRAELAISEGQYRFNVAVQGNLMRCLEVPGVVLERFTSFSHSEEDRERLRKMNEFLKEARKLSPKELEELMKRLSQRGDNAEVA